jgi:hypothetical protein
MRLEASLGRKTTQAVRLTSAVQGAFFAAMPALARAGKGTTPGHVTVPPP